MEKAGTNSEQGSGSGLRTVPAVVLAVAGVLVLPAAASGHEGEAHTEEAQLAPRVEKVEAAAEKSPEPSGKAERSTEVPRPSGGRQAEAVAVAAELPPEPEEPQSNPAIHFIALGLVAVIGAGVILLRRRNATG